VLHQEHPALLIHDHGANAERHTTGESPIKVEKSPQHRLKGLSQGS
jgi:hypothetical protein